MILCKILQVQRQKSKLVNFFLLSWILIELRIFVDLGTQTARVLHNFPSQKTDQLQDFTALPCHFRSSRPARRKAPGRVRPVTLLKKRRWHRGFPVNFVQNLFSGCWLLSVCLSYSQFLFDVVFKIKWIQVFLCILFSLFV